MKKLSDFQAISKEEMSAVQGGISLEDLINIMWNLTPDGGGSHWTNLGNGDWGGTIWW